MNNARQLVTLRQVDKISPIEGADRIVLAAVDGWNCIGYYPSLYTPLYNFTK